jgi:hypothetical protein
MTMVEMDGEKGGKERVESRASDSDLDKLKSHDKEAETGTLDAEDLDPLKKKLGGMQLNGSDATDKLDAKQDENSKPDEKDKGKEGVSHTAE